MVLMAHCSVLFLFIPILSSYVISERVNKTFGSHTDLLECIDGLFLLPRTDGLICAFMRVYGQWERALVNLIADVLHRYDVFDVEQPNIMLDIGANIGTWSVPLSKLPNTIVHAFEPQRFILGHLRATLLANSIENVVPVYSVVGNSTGYMSINDLTPFPSNFTEELDAVNYGSFSIFSNLSPTHRQGLNHSRVPSVTLDYYRQTVLQGRCPVFMKLDIEFYELYAFVGGRQLIRECKPIIFFESHCGTLNRPLFLLLTSLDYDLYWVFAPQIDTKALAFYGFEIDMDTYNETSETEFNTEFFTSPNVLALPKRKATPSSSIRTIISDMIASQYNGTLFPIDVHREQFVIEDMEIKYCVEVADGEQRCGEYVLQSRAFIEQELEQNTHCNTQKVDDFLPAFYYHYSYLINKSKSSEKR